LDYDVLAKRIKHARHEKGYSQSKLAEIVGVSTNTIGRLEISYTTVSLKTFLAIANALDVDINFLVGHAAADDGGIESHLHGLTEKDRRLLMEIIAAVKAYMH